MKKFLAPVMFVAAFAGVFVACSAAQRQAETTVATDTTECLAKCGITKALAPVQESAESIASECGVACGVDLLTNADERNALLTIISGTQSAKAAAHKTDASQ